MKETIIISGYGESLEYCSSCQAPHAEAAVRDGPEALSLRIAGLPPDLPDDSLKASVVRTPDQDESLWSLLDGR
jgi:hypothetical protein